ncbi:FAD/NAD(P)-binding domain-containing protein [Trametopsis cervina]|nr:FAD/NAD(P)-binding domain-containing protein [Trametopsis cervina]
MSSTRKTTLPLDFLIIGGGIGGCSAAYMLREAGHNVRVLERLPGIGTPAAGVRVPPNMSKILQRWIGEEELLKRAIINLETPWHDLHTGAFLGRTQFRQEVITETGGHFLLMAHEDVHRLVYDLATSAGARVDFDVRVTRVTPGQPRPSVTLESGEVISADIIVGADGPTSIVREVVIGEDEEVGVARPEGYTVFGAVVPRKWMETDAELKKFIDLQGWPLLPGDDRSLCAHPIRNHQEFSLMIHWPDHEAHTPDDAQDTWLDTIRTDTLDYSTLAPAYQHMMKGASCLWRTRSMVRPPVESRVDESERIVLLGEAAHTMYPGATHAASMAVEDAVVLGQLFSHLSALDQVSSLLYAYHELRHTRAAETRSRDASNIVFTRLPPGPERAQRDIDLGRCVVPDEHDDGRARAEFENMVGVFGYDAYDAAEEWWMQWGRYKAGNDVAPPLYAVMGTHHSTSGQEVY